MKSILFSILILIAQPFHIPGNFTITTEGKILASVNRHEFMIPVLDGILLDIKKYNAFSEKIANEVYREPKNARVDELGMIKPENIGYRLNKQRFTELFYTYYTGDGPSTIEVPIQTIYPRITSELLSTISVEQIGQYRTYYKTRNEERSHNISLAIESINNHVVFPGETFSFNEVVGKRTKEKGYLPAPVIVRGELTEGIGGGICQVSSTLYNAVDLAGLEIVQRYTHSRHVPYVPPGRDATVSWYGPDFKFKNKYNQPILIRAKTYQGKVMIMIYSSEMINYKPRKIPNI